MKISASKFNEAVPINNELRIEVGLETLIFKEVNPEKCMQIKENMLNQAKSVCFVKKESRVFWGEIPYNTFIQDGYGEKEIHLCGRCRKICPKTLEQENVWKFDYIDFAIECDGTNHPQLIVGKCTEFGAMRKRKHFSPQELREKNETMYMIYSDLNASKNFGRS